MPNKVLKSYAKQSKKSPQKVEKIWKDTESEVSKRYPKIKKGSSRYYSLVNAITKKKLKLEDFEEESQASTTTTSANIAPGMSGAYYKRTLVPSKKEIQADDIHNKRVLNSFKGS